MARVSDSELRDLVDARDDERVTPFIEDAHALVEELLANHTPPLLVDSRMKLIEKNLAAHFWVLAKEKGGLVLERMGDAINRYNPIENQPGLSSTRFGQQVIALDSTGELYKVLSYQRKAQLRVVKRGPPRSYPNSCTGGI